MLTERSPVLTKRSRVLTVRSRVLTERSRVLTERSRVLTERSRGGKLYTVDYRLGFARRAIAPSGRHQEEKKNPTPPFGHPSSEGNTQ